MAQQDFSDIASLIPDAQPSAATKPAAQQQASEFSDISALLPDAAPAQSGVDGFVAQYRPLAERVAKQAGVAPETILGQWGLETGWGKSVIPGTNNLGNIKDFSGGGVLATDNMTGSRDAYRKYGSAEDFGDDFAGLLARRYKSAIGSGQNADRYFTALKTSGYAEDPDYVKKGVAATQMAARAMGSAAPASLQAKSEYGSIQPQPPRSTFDAIKDMGSALWQGAKSTARSVGATGSAYIGNLSDVELAAEAQKSDVANNPAALQSLQEEIARRKAANPNAGILDAAADVIGAALQNKEGMAQMVANQAPNSVVALGGAWAGGKAGAAVGSAFGPAGTVVGGVLGGLAGMFLGNAAMETGGKAIEKAEGGFTPQERTEAIEEGAVKAGVITAVDAATFKLGGAIASSLNKGAIRAGARAEAKVLADAGINIADGAEIVAALAKNPALRKTAIEAGEKAAKAASSTASRIGTAGTLLTTETLGEGVGEYGGELAATGQADPYDAALEAISSFSQSAPQAAMSMVQSASNRLDTKAIVAAAPEMAPVIEKAATPNSPLSRAAMAANTPEVVAQRQAAQAGALGDAPAAEAAPAAAKDAGVRLAELEAIAKGTPSQQVTDESGNPLTIPGEPGRFFTQEEKAEYDQLVQMRDATEKVRNADKPQVDEISTRVEEISASIRENGTLQAMRDAGENTNALLKDLAIAKSKSTAAAQREQALARVEFALGMSDQLMPARQPRESADPIQAQLSNPQISESDREELSINYFASKNQALPEKTRQRALERAQEIVGRYAAPVTGRAEGDLSPAVLGEIAPQPGSPEDALRQAERFDSGAYQFKAEGFPDEAAELELQADAAREEAAVRREAIEQANRVEQVPAPTVATPAGPGPAALRKRKATLRQLVDNGLGRVERRNDGFFLVSQNGRQEFKLDGMADAQLARTAIADSIRDGAAKANTNPTEGQKQAGNYKVGEIKFDGLTLAVENPQGSTRSGVDPNGERWETVMPANYGYIRGSAMAADGDKVDIYLPNNARSGSPAWIIDQYNDDGSFDETKTVLGVRTAEEATRIYDAGYSDGSGPRRRGAVTEMSIEDFKAWANSAAAKKPAGAPRVMDEQAAIVASAAADGLQVTGTMPVRIDGETKNIGLVSELPDAESIARGGRATRISKKQGEVLQAIAQAFGKKVQFFYEPKNVGAGDGFIMNNDRSTIYLNIVSGRSPIVVFGHELMHQLKRDNPEAHAAIAAVVERRVNRQAADNLYGKELGYSGDSVMEELISDIGGDLMSDKTFWSDVMDEVHAQNDTKAARKIIAKLADFLMRSIEALSRNLRSYADTGAGSKLVDDMTEIRAAFRGALADYIKQQGISKPAMQAEILKSGQDAVRSAARIKAIEDEYKALEQQLRASDSWMKAPNGNKTELSAKQYVMVRTPAFKAWFGDWENDPANASKAIDENGEPKVFYHGSKKAGFTEFDTDGEGKTRGTGAFFTDDFRMAAGYSGSQNDAPVYSAEQIFSDPDLIDGLSIEQGILVEVVTSSRGDKSWEWYESEEAALEELELDPGEELVQKPGYRMTDPDGYETAGTREEILDAISSLRVEAPGVYDVFLNVRDMVEVDWNGNNWDDGPKEDIWNILDENGDVYDTAYSQEEVDAAIARNPGFSAEQDEQSIYESTDDAARSGRDMDADGILIKNVFDTGPYGYAEDGNVLVVYDPKNIKSASTNTGAFDPSDANITRSARRDDALTVEAYHFSRQPRNVLSTGAYGSGLQGSDRDAIMEHPDKRLRKRLYFYVNKGTGVRPESGVGGIAHKAILSNIYDSDADVKRLKQGRDKRAFESAVLDAGYDGYLARLDGSQPGQVILLGQKTVEPEVLGPRTQIPEAKVVPQPTQRNMDAGDRIMANSSLPAGRMELSMWSRVLRGTMPDVHAELEANGVFAGDEGSLYKDELVARARRMSSDITASKARQDPAIGDKTDVAKLPKGREIPTSVAVGSLESSLELARSKSYRRGRDLKVDLQNRVLAAAKAARVNLSERTQALHKFLSGMVVSDAKYALQSNENAVGWYDQKVSRAIGALSTVHPEIETDKRARLAFLWALATTSNGLKVDKNFELAERAYRSWKETGVMPTDIGIGNASKAINKGMAQYNELSKKVGDERLLKFMSTNFAVSEIENMLGVSVGGEWMPTPVRGAAILGPKIGNGFFSNLNGYFDALTMDRWLMRTWGRMTGTLVEANKADIDKSRAKLSDVIATLSAEERKTMGDLIGKTIKKNLTRAEVDTIATASQKASMKVEKREVMMSTDAMNEFRKAANLHHMTMDGQKEAPEGPGERNWIRAVFQTALEALRGDGLNMTMSDLQALLWYPERRLYDAAKSDEDVSNGYEDDEAPDYANAAFNLAVKAGVSEVRVRAAMDAAEARGTVQGAQLSAGEKADMLSEFRAAPEQAVQLAFEVAPDPNNKALTQRWSTLPEREKTAITKLVKDAVLKDISNAVGVEVSKTVQAIGGYAGLVNPNLITEYKRKKVSIEDARALAAAIGIALDQDSVALIDPRASGTAGIVRITLPFDASRMAQELFTSISSQIPGVDGFTARGRNFDVLNFTDTPTEELAGKIERAIANVVGDVDAAISFGEINSELVEKAEYANQIQGARPRAGEEVLGRIRGIRDRARQIVAAELERGDLEVPGSAGAARRGNAGVGQEAATGSAAGSVQDPGGIRRSARRVALEGGQDQRIEGREEDGSLTGLPRDFNVAGQQIRASHWAPAEAVARKYMADAGLEYTPPVRYAKVDPDRAKRIAAEYDKLKHDPQNPQVKAAYEALARETIAQYRAVIDSGLQVEFIDFAKQGDPYAASPRLMTEDVRNNNHMWLFSTRDGFGSDAEFDPIDNPLLAETEFTISGQKALVNDLFRVVHDYFGHVKEGVGFRADGEENTWRAHSSMFSPLAQRALTTETRGQNSWVNYGPHGETNRKAGAAETHYADQKVGLLPQWVSEEGRRDSTPAEYNQRIEAMKDLIACLRK